MQEKKTHGLTRRNFIKGAAMLGATGALVGCSPQGENLEENKGEGVPGEEIYCGVCRGNCFGGCKLDIHVRDGQIVRTTAGEMPDPQYNRICTKGLAHMGRIYSANRVQYPMKRVGERGKGEFERITWDEALEEISSKWKGYREDFGPESIMLVSQSGNLSFGGGIHGIGAYLSRFANIMGFSKANGNLDWSVIMSNIIACGGQDAWGAGANEPTDYKNADTFICWGANPAVSQPHNMHFIEDARDAGTRFIVIDPVCNMTAARADKFIPIKATTDGALAMGLINEVVKNGWHDEDFLRDHTEAPLLVKEDGSLLKMSDFGVEPTEGDVNPMTGKPAIIDPYVVWDEDANAKCELDKAKKPAITGVSEVEGIPVKTTFDYLMEIAAQYPLEEVERITGVSVADAKEPRRDLQEGQCGFDVYAVRPGSLLQRPLRLLGHFRLGHGVRPDWKAGRLCRHQPASLLWECSTSPCPWRRIPKATHARDWAGRSTSTVSATSLKRECAATSPLPSRASTSWAPIPFRCMPSRSTSRMCCLSSSSSWWRSRA